MGIKSVFASDEVKMAEGVWFPIPAAKNEDGTIPEVLLGRAGDANPIYQAAFEKHSAKLRRLAALNMPVPPKEDRAVMVNTYADAVILDWRNMQYPNDGEHFAYSKENARRILTELPDFFTFCATNASERANFTSEEEEKN